MWVEKKWRDNDEVVVDGFRKMRREPFQSVVHSELVQ